MNFELLWIDALLISLLWVAAFVAFAGRVKRKWGRSALLAIALGAPTLVQGAFFFGSVVLKLVVKTKPDWFGYTLSLLLAYLAGAFLILHRARRHEPGLPPAAATWRRGPLVLVMLMAVAVGYMAFCNMDYAIRARCAILSVKVHALYLAASPAIVSDAQNAAPLYEQAFSRLRDDPPVGINNPPLGDNETFDSNEPATIAFLGRQAGTILLLRKAASIPACRFDQDLADPNLSAIMASLKEERRAAIVLNLDAREELARGHASIAILDAAAILRMSRHYEQRPMLVSALVGFGLDALGNKTLEEALGSVKNPQDLAALRLDELPSIGRAFQQALRGEEAYGLICFGNMPVQMDFAKGASTQDTSLMTSVAGQGAYIRVFFLDLDAYLGLMGDMQDWAVQPYYEIRDQLRDSIGNYHGLFTSLLAPSWSRAFETAASAEAGDACARAAVAMTRFRLDHGRLPSRLSDLVPAYLSAVPIDPFNGHSLRLAVTKSQWVIYSIGPDGIDDGGAERIGDKGDVIFTLTAPTAEATTRP